MYLVQWIEVVMTSGQSSSGGGSTAAFQKVIQHQYNTAMSEAKEQRVEAKKMLLI